MLIRRAWQRDERCGPPMANNGAIPPWLEISDGDAPLLLIAPHGGRAGRAAHATLHPKVNDLETAAITRELARRLDAAALVNAGMDRNELDCNRLSQVLTHAPWILEIIAERVGRIVARHGHATVLLIHGWNIIEPRIDFGLGLRQVNGKLHPPAGAHVSASDSFINGPVRELSERLRETGIIPSFGMRYPGGGLQNLLQAFTARHETNTLPALRALAAMASRGEIDALQLEMSVTLRLPGAFRTHNIDALSKIFSRGANDKSAGTTAIPIIRESPPRIARKPDAAKAPSGSPIRVGIEFFDPALRIGGMVSFDFGPGAAGGRIMVMFGGRCVAMFTAEGRARLSGEKIALGPLSVGVDAREGGLQFRGPAVVVNDGTAYMSVERALAAGRLDDSMEVSAALELCAGSRGFADLFERLEQVASGAADAAAGDGIAQNLPSTAAFGRLRGMIALDGRRRTLDAVARVGVSFSGLGPHRFDSRRMVWACFRERQSHTALEARVVTLDGEAPHQTARLVVDGQASECDLARFDLDVPSPKEPPERIAAHFTIRDQKFDALVGRPETFMTLSRPGPGGVRIWTSLGFAIYRLGTLEGAGMFEHSRLASLPETSSNRR
jgi:hypothetical protein